MDHNQKYYTIRAMQQYGGSFVQCLAKAWERADADNSERIENAFPEYLIQYGPESKFYQIASQD